MNDAGPLDEGRSASAVSEPPAARRRIPFVVWIVAVTLVPPIAAAIFTHFAGPVFAAGFQIQPWGMFAWLTLAVTIFRGANLAMRWTALGPDLPWVRIVGGPGIVIAAWTIGCAAMAFESPDGFFLYGAAAASPQLAFWTLLAACGERDLQRQDRPVPERFGIRECLLALAMLGVILALGRLALEHDGNPFQDPADVMELLFVAGLPSALIFPFEASLRLAIAGGSQSRRYLGASLIAVLALLAFLWASSKFASVASGEVWILLLCVAANFALAAAYEGLFLLSGRRTLNVRRRPVRQSPPH